MFNIDTHFMIAPRMAGKRAALAWLRDALRVQPRRRRCDQLAAVLFERATR